MKDETIEMRRALAVIARIAFNEDPDEKNQPWSDVYMIAHSFAENCPHPEWRKVIDRVEQQLKNV
jgi:hypothetical protein